MLVPLKKTAVIVDQMAFRRARVESFLEPWARTENVELISLQPERAHAILAQDGCEILIYDVGGAYPISCETIAEIQVLHELCPRAALVILSDDLSPASIGAVLNSGARGYLSNSMPPELALHALSFILHGGTYFPATAILTYKKTSDGSAAEIPQSSLEDLLRGPSIHATSQRERVSFEEIANESLQQRRSVFDVATSRTQHEEELSAIHCAAAQLDNAELQLTDRQHAILRCICRGDSNKVIARTFDIAESTVKIHVKTILRKIRVKNRTQAAIWAIQNGLCKASESSGALSKSTLV